MKKLIEAIKQAVRPPQVRDVIYKMTDADFQALDLRVKRNALAEVMQRHLSTEGASYTSKTGHGSGSAEFGVNMRANVKALKSAPYFSKEQRKYFEKKVSSSVSKNVPTFSRDEIMQECEQVKRSGTGAGAKIDQDNIKRYQEYSAERWAAHLAQPDETFVAKRALRSLIAQAAEKAIKDEAKLMQEATEGLVSG